MILKKGSDHQYVNGFFLLKNEGRFFREKIPLYEVGDYEVADEESVKRLGGTIGWGAAGAILFGPAGLIAGAVSGGVGKDVTIVCCLRDGRKFLATVSSRVHKKLMASQFGREKPAKVLSPKMMECPDCEREISRQASSCPGCGRPLSERDVADAAARHARDEEQRNREQADAMERTRERQRNPLGGCLKWTLIVFGVLFLLLLLGSFLAPPGSQ